MEVKYCQSCAMPMGDTDEMYGTNSDGTKNEDYCKYCYMEGSFTSDISKEEMIEVCVPHMVSGNSGMNEDESRNMMKDFFPTLKRWKKG
ncbi:transcriptional regulator [Alkalibaculum sp. M08DMB]|uniref:Transcriptional regulator n=1 Tax=Alkalibaculum sporogenes TaxID=2655001 RepID=A0A6A7K4D5_9FIRM|nr:zinc ribbon domain-containing protein [Alkalibaculum sporogenes]MPW24248.1 transcriptional regulator [Alkalibaculum sporogenes]